MKMKIKSVMSVAMAVAVLAGCSGDSTTPAAQAQLKAALTQKHIDMSHLSADQRARVQGFIDRAKTMGPASKNAGKQAGQ